MQPFVPSPPDSLRQSESSSQDSDGQEADDEKPSRLHYSKVWLSALRLGYTRSDLAVMPYGEVIFDLAAMNDDGGSKQEHKHEQKPDVTKATQEDIRTMLG